MDLGCRIRCAASFLCLAALRSWQAVSHGRPVSSCIPLNKARIGVLEWSESGQALLCKVRQSIAVVLPWRKPKTAVVQALDSFNKASSYSFCCCNFISILSPLPRGGSVEFEDGSGALVRWWKAGNCFWLMDEISFTRGGSGVRKFFIWCDVDKQLLWSEMPQIEEQSRWPLIWLSTEMTNRWSTAPTMSVGVSSTSRWRPYLQLAMASLVFPRPSGFVPGIGEDGRGLSSLCCGGGRGADCVFHFMPKDLFVICRGLTVIVFSVEDSYVKCSSTADI